MKLNEAGLKKLISAEVISERVKELGKEITRDFEGKDLLIVGILKGALFFMADLTREIKLPAEIDYMRVSSYGDKTEPGKPELVNGITAPLTGKHVLLVDDIMDTGQTLGFITESVSLHKPASLRICALIDKRERRANDIVIDYTGFRLDEGYVVGYGMDLGEEGRNLPDIYSVK